MLGVKSKRHTKSEPLFPDDGRIEHLKKTIATLTAQRDEAHATIVALRARIEGLQNERDDAEELIEELEGSNLREDEVRDLARARRLIKDGDVDAGRDELERVLDRTDSCWRLFA